MILIEYIRVFVGRLFLFSGFTFGTIFGMVRVLLVLYGNVCIGLHRRAGDPLRPGLVPTNLFR